MRADKSKFKEQRRPDSLSGTATASLHERVNHPVSVQHLSLTQEPFLLQPCFRRNFQGAGQHEEVSGTQARLHPSHAAAWHRVCTHILWPHERLRMVGANRRSAC